MFNLYNEILTEHNLHPNNKCSLADATHHQHGINPNCGDEITLSLKLNNNIIEDASFQGSGCAISQASTDIMIDLMLDQPIDKAKELCRLFIGMVQGTITDEKELAPLDEALTFKNISKIKILLFSSLSFSFLPFPFFSFSSLLICSLCPT